jgi:hypothetical protein
MSSDLPEKRLVFLLRTYRCGGSLGARFWVWMSAAGSVTLALLWWGLGIVGLLNLLGILGAMRDRFCC